MSLGVLGCSPTTNATKNDLNLTARQIVGTSLIGAKGATVQDQDKIDDTVAGLCGSGAWKKSECKAHQDAQN